MVASMLARLGALKTKRVGARSPNAFQAAADFGRKDDRDGQQQRREGGVDQPGEGGQVDEAGEQADENDQQDDTAQ